MNPSVILRVSDPWQAWRRSRNAWLGFTVLPSLLVCAAIIAMYSMQSRALDQAASVARALRQARADLTQGFLHTALGGSASSPWDRDRGPALMEQGIRQMRGVLEHTSDAGAVEATDRQLKAFAGVLAAHAGGRSADSIELRVAYYELDRLSSRLERETLRELRQLRGRQEVTFWLVLAGAGALLALMSAGAAQAARREIDALKAQREADDRFAQLADNVRDVFWLRDAATQQILFVNAAYRTVWGRSPASLLADPRQWIEAIHPDERSRVKQLALQSVDGPSAMEYRIVLPDDSVRWIRDRGFPVHDEQGRVVRISGIAEDITARKQAEEELALSAQRLRTVIDLVPHAIWAKDREGRYLLVNRAAADWLGHDLHEMIGRRGEEAGLEPQDAEADREVDRQVLATGQRHEGLATYRRRGEADVVFMVNRLPFCFTGAEADAVLGVATDVTALKRAQEQLKELVVLLQATLHGTDHGVLVAGPDGRPLLWNDRMVHLLGGVDALQGRSEAEVLAALGEDPAAAGQGMVVRRGDGRALECHAEPMVIDARPAGRVWTVRDVTVREQAMADALAREHELERRVQERTRELAAANRELEAFSGAVSHDLRAPLAAIQAFTEVVLRKYADQLAPEGQGYLRRVLAASETMQAMTRGLLELSQHALASVHRRPLDLSRMAHEAYALHAHALGERRVEFLVQEALAGSGDPALVATLLQNLIGNALKYSRQRDPARIEVGAAEEGGVPHFYVRDNGVGFDPEWADRLFKPFSRLHSASEFDGHGIGLATASRIVARHGGRIWAEGAVGEGATFRFTLGLD